MHRIVINGAEHDLCAAAVSELFSEGRVVTSGGRILLLADYTSLTPPPLRRGSRLYCDCHGTSCP